MSTWWGDWDARDCDPVRVREPGDAGRGRRALKNNMGYARRLAEHAPPLRGKRPDRVFAKVDYVERVRVFFWGG